MRHSSCCQISVKSKLQSIAEDYALDHFVRITRFCRIHRQQLRLPSAHLTGSSNGHHQVSCLGGTQLTRCCSARYVKYYNSMDPKDLNKGILRSSKDSLRIVFPQILVLFKPVRGLYRSDNRPSSVHVSFALLSRY